MRMAGGIVSLFDDGTLRGRIWPARGLQFLCAMFESEDEEAIMLEDRLLQVSISLLRL